MAKMKLSAPWVIYAKEVTELFREDPEIIVCYDEGSNTIRLYVENAEKADALTKLLPAEKTFGNVTVRTVVFPANVSAPPKVSLFQTAFKGNPVFVGASTVEGIFTNPVSYVVFKNKVVQYYADNLHDLYGNCSTLYQEIAKDVFGEDDGICFCTDVEQQSKPAKG